MDRTTAASKLQGRRRRLHRKKSGPKSLQFSPNEIEAIRTLTCAGKTQSSLARMSGLSISQFKEAMKKDEKLRDAWQQGKDERLEARIADLEKQSRAGNVKATELLLRYDNRDAGPQRAAQDAGTTININADSVAAQIDGRKFVALANRLTKQVTPTVIEHEPLRVEETDPIKAGLAHMKEKK